MYLISFSLLLVLIPFASPLTCHCSLDSCNVPNCTTDGNCVVMFVGLEFDSIRQECISPEFIPNTCTYSSENRYCCQTEFCNNSTILHQLFVKTDLPGNTSTYFPTSTSHHQPSNQPSYLTLLVSTFVAIIICVILIFLIFFPIIIWWRSQHLSGVRLEYKQPQCLDEMTSHLDSTYESCSGSGAGMPQLSQVTIARQVEKQKLIGSGRYGEVWQGIWRDQQVAIKISYSQDAPSWESEISIYMTDLMRHENILGFVAADKIDLDFSLQYWLITDFMPHGSLLEFLSEHSLSLCEAFKLSKGLAAGVAHLHTEIKGGHRFNSSEGLYKPCIIHRDLKSKNILVNCNGEAIIGDFGLAVRYTRDSHHSLYELFYKREGTKRYLSPELMEEKVEKNDICEIYKRADVYSMCLVLWEIFRRCIIDGNCDECELPYYNCVSREPSFQEMKETVLIREERPHMSGRWSESREISEVSEIIQECWLLRSMYSSPSKTTSLPSLLIKKRLISLQNQVCK